ncbi:MAG: hypothetical protein JXC31_06005 [Acholeplasmataceae bacterium]|nr:hypothetical protein [Acholeplasmataceae bacterium]
MRTYEAKKYRKLIFSSVLYIILVTTMTTFVTYAWFTISNVNNASLVSNISEIEAEYEFFVYQNANRDGSDDLTLIDNICLLEDEDLCYLAVTNPMVAFMIEGSSAPGEKFSFAIRITSVNNPIGTLSLDFGGLNSIGYDIEENKLQTAFFYQVDKISYLNYGIETDDLKDSLDIVHHQGFFTYDNDTYYPLISNVPMQDQENANTMIIIYFSLYFDPYIYGEQSDGTPYTNSNIFMNQTFTIDNLFMSVSN